MTEDEIKLMLRGAEDCGAIEEEEQVITLLDHYFLVVINLFCYSFGLLINLRFNFGLLII